MIPSGTAPGRITSATSVIADGLVGDRLGDVKLVLPLDTAPTLVTVRLNRGAVSEDCLMRHAAQ
jgi:hypothetical protein